MGRPSCARRGSGVYILLVGEDCSGKSLFTRMRFGMFYFPIYFGLDQDLVTFPAVTVAINPQ